MVLGQHKNNAVICHSQGLKMGVDRKSVTRVPVVKVELGTREEHIEHIICRVLGKHQSQDE